MQERPSGKWLNPHSLRIIAGCASRIQPTSCSSSPAKYDTDTTMGSCMGDAHCSCAEMPTSSMGAAPARGLVAVPVHAGEHGPAIVEAGASLRVRTQVPGPVNAAEDAHKTPARVLPDHEHEIQRPRTQPGCQVVSSSARVEEGVLHRLSL